MERREFRRRYFEAKRQCINLTVPLILESLPAIHVFFITLAPEDRAGDSTGDERYEALRKVGQTCAHEEDRMVDWLSRDDFAPFAPRNVDLSIYGTTAIHTTFEFVVSGVFARPVTDVAPRFPDNPLSPWTPRPPRVLPGWRSVAESGRFSINWHKREEPTRTE